MIGWLVDVADEKVGVWVALAGGEWLRAGFPFDGLPRVEYRLSRMIVESFLKVVVSGAAPLVEAP